MAMCWLRWHSRHWDLPLGPASSEEVQGALKRSRILEISRQAGLVRRGRQI